MNHLYTLLALDIARDRARTADEDRRASAVVHARPARPSALRRGLANSLAAVARGSASVVRRLDDCVADDLGRSLSPSTK